MGTKVVEVKPRMSLNFEASHTAYHTKDGARVPSVTTVLGLINKPYLLNWAWDLGTQGIDFQAARQKAADIGTIAHALCEAHLRGMELDRGNLPPDKLSMAENGFGRFLEWWDGQGFAVLHTELKMVSELHRVGGTLDVMARRLQNGKLALVDIKTSKGIYDEMLIQVATYAAIYEECYGEVVEDCFIVRIGKEEGDDVEVRRVTKRPERLEAFLALLNARKKLQATGMKV